MIAIAGYLRFLDNDFESNKTTATARMKVDDSN